MRLLRVVSVRVVGCHENGVVAFCTVGKTGHARVCTYWKACVKEAGGHPKWHELVQLK